MERTFLNYEFLHSFPVSQFIERQPFPWFNFHQFLTEEGFAELHASFPSLQLFEQHRGIERMHSQRPHDRYYLAYEKSLYGTNEGQGLVRKEDLPPSWQEFLNEIQSSERYHQFIRQAFGIEKFDVRCAWHVGVEGSEVSPHCDGEGKLGTHIFYFNTSQDWDEEWGGATLVLSGRTTTAMNPDFDDFTSTTKTNLIDNRSFLFKNTKDAWHGVRPLTCPPGHYRRLFNIIFESVVPADDSNTLTHSSPLSKVKSIARRLVPTR